jgi:membrane-associated phospholipid phosphatase
VIQKELASATGALDRGECGQLPWAGELRLRLVSCWRKKLWLTFVLNLLFWGFYGFLGRHAFFPLRGIPPTWLDNNIRFSPEPWGWIYLSQFLYTGTIPWFIATAQAIRRYALGLTFICLSSFLLFLCFPVRSPRPETLGPGIAMALIERFDGSLNAFPSLHAAFMTYTFALGWRLFGRRLPPGLVVGFIAWGLLILYATLATKQHYTWDLVAGALLGCASDRLASGSLSSKAVSTTACSNDSIFHEGDR